MEIVDEPIQVVARFRGGRVEPTRFLWNGRPEKVCEVTGRWAAREGGYQIYRFALLNDTGTYFEISFHTRNMDWRLDRVVPE